MTEQSQTLILAGGGTGGHLFPGLAVADEFVRRDPSRRVVVVGTGRAVERRAVATAGYELRLLAARPLRGRNARDQLLSLAAIPVALLQSAGLILRLRPAAVVGLGGYASGPMVLSAAAARVPTAVMEQNSIPGSTNKILDRLGVLDRAYLTFESSARFFRKRAVRIVGNPVRDEVIAVRGEPLDVSRKRVLVVGGSQGAQSLNMSLPEAFAQCGVEGVEITHQCGDAMAEGVRRHYDELGIHATVVPFIDDMATAYRDASLVVCRAGATTLTELAVVGRPSVLIPFPHAIDDHQRKNAEELERAGASVVVLDEAATPERLASLLDELLDGDGERLGAMAEAARGLGRVDATERVVDDLEELISVRSR